MINRKTTLEQLGAIVCQALQDAGLDCFLSGGAVASIYSKNRFESYDLDFVSYGDRKKIARVMESLGFNKDRSRLFNHTDTVYMVEFPGTSLQIGDQPIREFATRVVNGKTLKLLTPTDCVKDRLAAYIHWKDRQGLEQAALVALNQRCKLSTIESFCKSEGVATAYQDFLTELKRLKKSAK